MSDYILNGYPKKLVNDFLKSTIAVNLNNDAAEKGQLFQVFHKATVLAGANLDISFITPTDKDVLYFPTILSTSGDKVTLQFFEGSTVADGVAITPICQNRQLASVAGAVVKSAPTVSATGTQLVQAWLPGSTGTGQTRSGSTSGGDTLWKFKRNTAHVIRCVNGSSASNVIQVNIVWVERDI